MRGRDFCVGVLIFKDVLMFRNYVFYCFCINREDRVLDFVKILGIDFKVVGFCI